MWKSFKIVSLQVVKEDLVVYGWSTDARENNVATTIDPMTFFLMSSWRH
jgi:hypothetical protein